MNLIKPTIILVEPQLPANVGMVARVMLNFGLNQLYLVKPREADVLKLALPAAAGADKLLQQAIIFPSLNDALAEFKLVYAFTKRRRHLNKPYISLKQLFLNLTDRVSEDIVLEVNGNLVKNVINSTSLSSTIFLQPTCLLFGKESNGLSNQDLAYAQSVITVETNHQFGSLSLMQAVALFCYEWGNYYQESISTNLEVTELINIDNKIKINKKEFNQQLANQQDLHYLYSHIQSLLQSKGYEKVKIASILNNFKSLIARSLITKREVKTLFRIFMGKNNHSDN